MLTILPYYTPAAIRTIYRVIIANLFGLVGVMLFLDSLATLLAAYLSYRIKNKWLVPVPPIAVNGLVIGGMLHYVYNFPLLLSILSITIGQILSCYILGGILMASIERTKQYIFPKHNRG